MTQEPDPTAHSPRPAPVLRPGSARRDTWARRLSLLELAAGFAYLAWRWGASLPETGRWLALPLVSAETLAWLGLVLFTVDTWAQQDVPLQAPPARLRDVLPPRPSPVTWSETEPSPESSTEPPLPERTRRDLPQRISTLPASTRPRDVGSSVTLPTRSRLRLSQPLPTSTRGSFDSGRASLIDGERSLSVDVFIATYDEEPELVRESVRAACQLTYPVALELNVYVLDDGRRESLRRVAEEEGVGYVSRRDNVGYKAGNLRHAMQWTWGDFIVICDADTHLFPAFLEETLGYFRDPRVAWVQTPQWFPDIPEGERLSEWLGRHVGRFGAALGARVERWLGPLRIGEDPLGNDAQFFFDVVQRRRNRAMASFCCGAASVHRRSAVMAAALRRYSEEVERELGRRLQAARRRGEPFARTAGYRAQLRDELLASTEPMPYQFHVSEDLYTSLVLHSDTAGAWRSVLHPKVLSWMLSPQDATSWVIQRFKYAGGTLDLGVRDFPLTRPGLPWPHRWMYTATLWSHASALWSLVLLLAPALYLVTGISPVRSYGGWFPLLVVPFLLSGTAARALLSWGIPGRSGRGAQLALIPVTLRALVTVLLRRPIRFQVTPKARVTGGGWRVFLPQLALSAFCALSIAFGAASYVLGNPLGLTRAGLLVNGLWTLSNLALLVRVLLVLGPLHPSKQPSTEGERTLRAWRDHLAAGLVILVLGVILGVSR